MIRWRNCRVRGSRGSRKSCSGGPCSSTTPSSRKQTRFAISRAKPISWVAMSIVWGGHPRFGYGPGKMTDLSQRTFRAVALERAASPEQLDHLVRITRPFDWILGFVICMALVAALTWGIIGRIPTRAEGQGILISGGGRVVDAVFCRRRPAWRRSGHGRRPRHPGPADRARSRRPTSSNATATPSRSSASANASTPT